MATQEGLDPDDNQLDFMEGDSVVQYIKIGASWKTIRLAPNLKVGTS